MELNVGEWRHATASILSIGDELVRGQTLDTNSKWLADRLSLAGIEVVEHATVDDDERRIARALERLGAATDLIVVTGGLGPTADDLTRFSLARVLSGGPDADRASLATDADSLEQLKTWFAGRGKPIPEANAVQALCPAGATMLANDNGTAPGLHAAIDRLACDVFCLPGPPRELQPMFARYIEPTLRGAGRGVSGVRLLLTFGLGESAVADPIGPLMDRDRPDRGLPLIGTTASRGVVTCRIRHTATDETTLRDALDHAEDELRAILGPAVFDRRDPAKGDDIDVTLALPATLIDLCRDAGARLVTAESCSAGLLASMIADVPGASDVLSAGWLTYANEAKTSMLGVPADTIKAHGAVSSEVARAMASGALERGCDLDPAVRFAAAITGIAGPGGGTEEKPVGTVWIAVADRVTGEIDTRRFLFKGNRLAVREWSARAAMGMVRLALLGENMELLGEVERLGAKAFT